MSELFEIPLSSNDSSFKIRTTLNGVELVLDFYWNTRLERWKFSILDAAETPLVMGLPLHVNLELIQRFEIPGLPEGQIIFYDGSRQNAEAEFDDIGDRCKLFFIIQ